MEPTTLKEMVEKALKSSDKLTTEKRQELAELANSLHENDNNIILLAKLKQ